MDKKNCFEIATPEKSYFVVAANAEEMHTWVKTIRDANSRLLKKSIEENSTPGTILSSGESSESLLFSQELDEDEKSPHHQQGGEAERSEGGEVKPSPIVPEKEKVEEKPRPRRKTLQQYRREGYLMLKQEGSHIGKGTCQTQHNTTQLTSSILAWRRRWFTMTGYSLDYYVNRMDKSLRGSIKLVTCTIQVNAQMKEPYCFSVITPGHSITVCAETGFEMEEWIEALRGASECLLESYKEPGNPLVCNISYLWD